MYEPSARAPVFQSLCFHMSHEFARTSIRHCHFQGTEARRRRGRAGSVALQLTQRMPTMHVFIAPAAETWASTSSPLSTSHELRYLCMTAPAHAGAAARGGEAAVTVTNAAFGWDPLRKPLLAALNFTLPAGSCAVIIGEVGCGKSSLLAALLGEMPRVRGTTALRGSVAYTAQDPWIQNATVEANILMGTLMDVERYAAVLHACALQADLASLPAGDQTEIGEKGVNLSGATLLRWYPIVYAHGRSWRRSRCSF